MTFEAITNLIILLIIEEYLESQSKENKLVQSLSIGLKEGNNLNKENKYKNFEDTLIKDRKEKKSKKKDGKKIIQEYIGKVYIIYINIGLLQTIIIIKNKELRKRLYLNF